MTHDLSQITEEQFGIKADPDDIAKLRAYIRDACGSAEPQTIARVFSSGEAAGFLTVNETYFFREPAHFSFLLELLPSFEQTGINICSAAVANGCEAYSIAMLIEAYNRSAAKPLRYHIDAFDLNPKVIETARQGIYSARTLREDGSCFRYMVDPYLKKLENEYGRETPGFDLASQYQVDPSLQKNIRFFVHNLMHELPPQEYDLIFFRNALIYFSPTYREQILSHLIAVLKEGGILIPGVSETALVRHAGIVGKTWGKNREEVFYFQKLGDGEKPVNRD